MTAHWLSDDDALLGELRTALAAGGPVPGDVIAGAKAAYELRNFDEELATLFYDSQADTELAGTFRSETMSVRSLVFGYDDITLDIDVLSDSFVGQLVPTARGSIAVETRGRPPVLGEIDELGMFSVPICPPGDVRFRVELADGTGFATGWTRI